MSYYYRRYAFNISNDSCPNLCGCSTNPCFRNIEWVENRAQSLIDGTALQKEHSRIESPPTILPDLDETYRCDKCDKNHFEEDCPYFGGPQHITVVRGSSRLAKLQEEFTARDSITRARISRLEMEAVRLNSGWKFCTCCTMQVEPSKLREVISFHTGFEDELHSYRWTCCSKEEGAPGCCLHIHTLQ